jgi:outer membrane protein assembly factor BamB
MARGAAVALTLISWAAMPGSLRAERPASAGLHDWPTFDGNAARTGSITADTTLSPANVGRLARRWVMSFPGDVADSTPILLARVKLANGGTRALLFQTTRYGTTYAVDARSGAILWRFTSPSPEVPANAPNARGALITTSTPVADPSGRFIYAPAIDGQVHKLVAGTGAEVRGHGFPLRLTLMPDVEKDASALNLANGYLYATTSGYIGDRGPYNGHLVALRLGDGAVHVFNTLCSNIRQLPLSSQFDASSKTSCEQTRSGIWSRAGAVVDPEPAMRGRVYVATGNGNFDVNRGGANYGDSVLALSADGSRLLGYYTPPNYQQLDDSDLDLGSTAPAILPRQPESRTPLMAVQGGKDQTIHLIDRTHLGGVGPGLQTIRLPGAVLFTQPAVWKQPGGDTWVFIGDNGALVALRLVTDAHGASRLVRAWSVSGPSTSPIVVNGIVISATAGSVRAFDASSGRQLWSSGPGSIGSVHWQSPIAVDGVVYISDQSGHLTAFALPGH